jgi:lipopolysaccharide transport system ATP-binding protein
VAKEGRTVLFVSHNMNAINRLCYFSILLEQGKVREIGPTKAVVEKYLSGSLGNVAQIEFESRLDKPVQYRAIRIVNQAGKVSSEIPDDQPVSIICEVEVKEKTPDIYFGIVLQNAEGVSVLFADSRDVKNSFPSNLAVGSYKISITVPPFLAPGTYFVTAGIATTILHVFDYQDAACCFHLINLESERTAARPGFINLRLPWQIQRSG